MSDFIVPEVRVCDTNGTALILPKVCNGPQNAEQEYTVPPKHNMRCLALPTPSHVEPVPLNRHLRLIGTSPFPVVN